MSGKHWSLEQRQRQAELIRNWSPWEKSTGPKTAAGKRRVSRNAFTGGSWLKMRQFSRTMNQLMREIKTEGV